MIAVFHKEMFATILHAKLHQSEKFGALWTWFGNVAAKATVQQQHFQDAVVKFGEKFPKQNETEVLFVEPSKIWTPLPQRQADSLRRLSITL